MAFEYSFTGSYASDGLVYRVLARDGIDAAAMVIRKRAGLGLEASKMVAEGIRSLRTITPDRIAAQELLELLASGKTIMAIKEVRAFTGLDLKEAKDAVDLVRQAWAISQSVTRLQETEQPFSSTQVVAAPQRPVTPVIPDFPRLSPPVPAPPRGSTPSLASETWPTPASDVDLTKEFANQLRVARRRAGEPSLSKLSGLTKFSKATLSRAFRGHLLPSWEVVETLLHTFGIPPTLVDDVWRRRWLLALEQRDPVGLHNPHDPFGERHPEPATENGQNASSSSSAGPASSSPPPGAPEGQVCDTCGSWVVDLTKHQAWHWQMENQIRRTLLRTVDDAASQ
ncbi:ribosomal protein L7/L12 [Actinocorallia sp. B10E7]|uniref:ribosomal protein L7/L12 n=1 Tax=Actinocorallia sp. B10E7 TaxID=3153558 RepID=UPI00325DD64A